MHAAAIAQVVPVRLRIPTGYFPELPSLESLFFAPLRFCGRQWVWLNDSPNNKVSQIALKVVAFICLIPATLVSFGIASIGAAIYPARQLSSTKYMPAHHCHLLSKDLSDIGAAQEIFENINNISINSRYNLDISRRRHILKWECTVTNQGRGGICDPDYYPDTLSREIVVYNTSGWGLCRYIALIKSHLLNQTPCLDSLYLCLSSSAESHKSEQLKLILSLYKSVKFYLPADMAFVTTETQ